MRPETCAVPVCVRCPAERPRARYAVMNWWEAIKRCGIAVTFGGAPKRQRV